jgi:hypothetical protein
MDNLANFTNCDVSLTHKDWINMLVHCVSCQFAELAQKVLNENKIKSDKKAI